MLYSRTLLTAVTAAIVAGPLSAGAQQPVTAFVNVTVIPMDREQVLAGQTVLVRGHTITAIGPAAQIKVPAGATRIDGQGKFLMPGLGDMHAHLFPPSWEDRQGIRDWYAVPRLFCYVANGVTTIRVLEDEDTASADVRRRVAKQQIIGPRMFLAVAITQTNRDGSLTDYIAAVKPAGYDFAAISTGSPWFNQAHLDTLVTTGIRLTGDVPNDIGIDGVLRAPYASIDRLDGYLEHLAGRGYFDQREPSIVWDSLLRGADAPRIDESKIPGIVAKTKRAGVWNTPMQAQAARMLDLWSGPGTAAKSPLIALRHRLIKNLHDAGAGLLLGTDAPTWGATYGVAAHQELEALVAAGLTPYQALETSTRNVAAFLGTSDSAGTVAAGKWADLMLLTGNPLDDIRNSARLAGVMVNGQWLPRAKLDAQLKTQACSIR